MRRCWLEQVATGGHQRRVRWQSGLKQVLCHELEELSHQSQRLDIDALVVTVEHLGALGERDLGTEASGAINYSAGALPEVSSVAGGEEQEGNRSRSWC